MDALKYAHHCLIEKIRQKQDQDIDKHSKSTSKSLSAIEEFCEKFDQSVRKSYIKPATLQLGGNPGNGMVAGTMGGPQMASGSMVPPEMTTPTKDMKFSMGSMGPMMLPGGMFTSPMAKKELDFQHMMSPNFKSLKDLTGMDSDTASMVSSSSHGNKTESKKHPSLPKEAVAIMLDWLRQHKDNPYPNDDEKAMLIKQTGLTINQINYWFTNARRRILPKWAQSCK